jgi:hypothetical protein
MYIFRGASHFLVGGKLLIYFVQEIIQKQHGMVANYSQSSYRHLKHPNQGSSFTITCQ